LNIISGYGLENVLKISYSSLAIPRQFAYHIFLRKRGGFVSLSGDGRAITFPPIHRHNPYPSNPFGKHIPFQGFSKIVYFLLSQDHAHHIVSLQLTTAKNRRKLATLAAVKNTMKGVIDIKRSGEYFTLFMAFSCYFATALSLTLFFI
jgi:hypothetical protein